MYFQSRKSRISPKNVAAHYVRECKDMPGFSKKYINKNIGNCFIFCLFNEQCRKLETLLQFTYLPVYAFVCIMYL